jgi:hypothetical protein
LSENIAASASPVILHGDNGSPLKGRSAFSSVNWFKLFECA